MTPELTAEQMRRAIVKACRWTAIQIGEWDGWMANGLQVGDPLYDLNACAEMEKVLFEDEILWSRYRDIIYRFETQNDTAFATALQRCRAFCQTLNLKGE